MVFSSDTIFVFGKGMLDMQHYLKLDVAEGLHQVIYDATLFVIHNAIQIRSIIADITIDFLIVLLIIIPVITSIIYFANTTFFVKLAYNLSRKLISNKLIPSALILLVITKIAFLFSAAHTIDFNAIYPETEDVLANFSFVSLMITVQIQGVVFVLIFFLMIAHNLVENSNIIHIANELSEGILHLIIVNIFVIIDAIVHLRLLL